MWKSISIAAVIASMGATASAEEDDWYVSGQFGVRAIEREAATAPGVDINVELDNGLYLSGAAGRYLGSNGLRLRVEGEIAWRGGNINNFDLNGVSVAVAGDGFSALSFMTNGYVDFENRSRFTPYVGAGIGLARITGDISDGVNILDDSATAFAFQGIGGVDVALTRNVSIFADLRYFRAVGTTMTVTGSAGSGDVDVEYDAYTVGTGIRVRF